MSRVVFRLGPKFGNPTGFILVLKWDNLLASSFLLCRTLTSRVVFNSEETDRQ